MNYIFIEAYVVLSRIKEFANLYLLSEIPDDIDFTPDEDYINMMQRLKRSILATEQDIKHLLLN